MNKNAPNLETIFYEHEDNPIRKHSKTSVVLKELFERIVIIKKFYEFCRFKTPRYGHTSEM